MAEAAHADQERFRRPAGDWPLRAEPADVDAVEVDLYQGSARAEGGHRGCPLLC